MLHNKFILVIFLSLLAAFGFSQTTQIQLNSDKIRIYSPYMAARHGGPAGLEQFKNSSVLAYTNEMWYFTESFYIKRNHLSSGQTLNEEIIDITRFEQQRKTDEDVVVVLPGFKDAIVLIAEKKLLFKPSYN